MNWNIDLLSQWIKPVGVDAFNQYQTQTSDGRPAEDRDSQCGAAQLALLTYWRCRFLLLVDEAKDILWSLLGRVPESTGETSEYDLMTFLEKRLGVSCTRHIVTSKGQAMSVLRSAIFQDHLAIALRCSVTKGQKPFHWVTAYGGTGPDPTHTATVRWYQSLGGTLQESTNDDFWAWISPYPAAGQAVIITVDVPQLV